MSTQNGSNWKGIFISYILGFFALIALAGNVNAAPICKSQVNGDQAIVTVTDTGVVASGGQSLPPGMVSYPGTERAGDIAASCSDNNATCQAAKWFVRFDQSKAGWPKDEDLGTDTRAVACQYDPQAQAQVCNFKIVDGMMPINGGKPRLHFSAKLPNGQVVAAYQPEGGCPTNKDGKGNSHTILTAAPN